MAASALPSAIGGDPRRWNVPLATSVVLVVATASFYTVCQKRWAHVEAEKKMGNMSWRSTLAAASKPVGLLRRGGAELLRSRESGGDAASGGHFNTQLSHIPQEERSQILDTAVGPSEPVENATHKVEVESRRECGAEGDVQNEGKVPSDGIPGKSTYFNVPPTRATLSKDADVSAQSERSPFGTPGKTSDASVLTPHEKRAPPKSRLWRTEEGSPRGFAVTLGGLKVWISHDYCEESTSYRYPLFMKTFSRHDGTQITLAAEDLSGVSQLLDTSTYRTRCVEKARRAAQEKNTYFKVKLNIDANAVVTSVFEHYVDVTIGPGPVSAASFLIVSNHVGYTLQMQAELGAYEVRLADFLTTVQGARLVPTLFGNRGVIHHLVRAADMSEQYRVVLPPQFLAKRSGEGALSVQFRHRSRWKGEVVTWRPKLAAPDESGDTVVELIPDKLYFSSRIAAIGDTEIGDEITALVKKFVRGSIEEPGRTHSAASEYRSDLWTLPLPTVETCITSVCEHMFGNGVTMFIETKDGDQVEVELSAVRMSDMATLKSELSLMIIPTAEIGTMVDAKGRRTLHVEGKAVTAPYAPLIIDGVEYDLELWVLVTWTYPDSATPAPIRSQANELRKYAVQLIDQAALHGDYLASEE